MRKTTKNSTKLAIKVSASVLLVLMLVLTIVGSIFANREPNTPPSDPLAWSIDKWDGESSSIKWQDSSSFANRGDKTFTINSAEEFVNFVNICNDTDELETREYFKDTTVYLNTNIDLAGHEINSIADFCGTFDGSYYTIFNAKINGAGLFANTEDATIKNVGLYNATIECDTDYAGGIVGSAKNTIIENTYVRLGSISGHTVGGLVGKFTVDRETNTTLPEAMISNSFASTKLNGTDVAGLVGETATSETNTFTIQSSYFTGTKNALINDDKNVTLDKVLVNPTSKNQFTAWDYSTNYDLTKTWTDYKFKANSQELNFNLPILSLFNKVFMTGSGYETVIVKDGVATTSNAISIAGAFAEVNNNETAEVNIIVEKIYLEDEATAKDGSTVTLNTAVDTTVVRGDNNPETMVSGEAGSTLILGDKTSTPAEYDEDKNLITPASNTPKLVLDGEIDRVKKSNLKTGALVYSVGKDFTMYSNVTLQNNINNNGTVYGGGLFLYAVESGAQDDDETVTIHGGTITNCHAPCGGGTAIIGTDALVENMNVSFCSGSGAYFSDVLDEADEGVENAKAMATRYGLGSRPMPLSGKESGWGYTVSSTSYKSNSGASKSWKNSSGTSYSYTYGGGCLLWTTYGNATLKVEGSSDLMSNTANFGAGMAASDNDCDKSVGVYIVLNTNSSWGCESNTATYKGGGIFCRGGVTLTAGRVLSNKAKYGGGVAIQGCSGDTSKISENISIGSGQVYSNSITTYAGGGLYYDRPSSPTLSPSTASQYISSKSGLSSSYVYSNSATDTTSNQTYGIYPQSTYYIYWGSSNVAKKTVYISYLGSYTFPTSGPSGSPTNYGSLVGYGTTSTSTSFSYRTNSSVQCFSTTATQNSYYAVYQSSRTYTDTGTDTGNHSYSYTFNATYNGGSQNNSYPGSVGCSGSATLSWSRSKSRTATQLTRINGYSGTTNDYLSPSYGNWSYGSYSIDFGLYMTFPTPNAPSNKKFVGWSLSSTDSSGITSLDRYDTVSSLPSSFYWYAIYSWKVSFSASVIMWDYFYGGSKPSPNMSNNPGRGTPTYYYSTSSSGGSSYLWSNVSSSTYLNAGTYYMYATIPETTDYQSYTTPRKAFTISKASFTAITNMSGYTYGGSKSSPSISHNPGGGSVTYYYRTSSSGSGSSWSNVTSSTYLNAGAYYMYAVVSATTNYNSYTTGNKSFTISKANISPSVNMSSYTYGGTKSTPSVSGNTGGGSVTYYYKLSSASSWSSWSSVNSSTYLNAGSYVMYASIGSTTNYNSANTANRSFTINKASFSASVNMAGYTYGASKSAPSVTSNPGGATVTYYYNTSNSNSGGTNWSNVTSGTSLNAGTYYMYASIPATTNYNRYTTGTKSFTISKASFSASVNMSGYTYDGIKPTPSVTSNPGGAAVTYYYRTTTTGSGTNWSTVTSSKYLDAGTYYMYASIPATTNYNGYNTSNTTFIIAKASISPVLNLSKTSYTFGDGTNPQTLQSITGNTGNGTVTYYYNTSNSTSGARAWSGVANSTTLDVGTYYIYATVGATTNYLGTNTVTKTITINRATLATPTDCRWSSSVAGMAEWAHTTVLGITPTYEIDIYKGNSLIYTDTSLVTSYDVSKTIRTNGVGEYSFTVRSLSNQTNNCANSESTSRSTAIKSVSVGFNLEANVTASINSANSYIMIAGESGVKINSSAQFNGGFLGWEQSSNELTIASLSSASTTVSLVNNPTVDTITLTPVFGRAVKVTSQGMTSGEEVWVKVYASIDDFNADNAPTKTLTLTKDGEINESIRSNYVLKIFGKTFENDGSNDMHEILTVYINGRASKTTNTQFTTSQQVGEGMVIEFKFALAYKTTLGVNSSELTDEMNEAIKNSINYVATSENVQAQDSENNVFTAKDADVKLVVDTSFLSHFEEYDFVGFTYTIDGVVGKTWNTGNNDFTRIGNGSSIVYEYNNTNSRPVSNIGILVKKRASLVVASAVEHTVIRSEDGLERQLSGAGVENIYAGTWTITTQLATLDEVKAIFGQELEIIAKGQLDDHYYTYEFTL